MKKTILLTSLFLLFNASSFAQMSTYHSPFGQTYRGDMQTYTPDNKPHVKIQKYKAEIDHIVLLNTNKTLSENVNIKELAEYIKDIEKVINNNFKNLTTSNEIVLQVIINSHSHSIEFAHKIPLNDADDIIFNKAYKEVNSITPVRLKECANNEDIKLELYYIVNNNLPMNE